MNRVVIFSIAVLGLFSTVASFSSGDASAQVKALDGFEVTKLYDVPKEQGSWVSITTDSAGRLITCDQYGALYRITLVDGKQTKIEKIELDTGRAQGILYAFDSLYIMAHGKQHKQGGGLYRIRDTNSDDQFDNVEMLRSFNGGTGEHGPHAIILSPDGKSIYICGGNHTNIPELSSSRVPQNWQEDQVLPRMWDAGGHAVGRVAPGGWICKIDPDGKNFELVSSGYRNQYDIAFAPDGELFTFDADMEWDIGSPWYRPTRVCHAASGSEFGWRSGTGKWPTYYPDSLPPVLDIGPGSPTGISFGTGAKFPAKYQNALFIADWSYGIIYAVHMQPDGATFKGEEEIVCTAPGLAVTDMVVNSSDGSLYFLTGGRRSQSALYRISYTGSESTAPSSSYPAANDLSKLRRSLEEMHVKSDNPANVIQQAWPLLSHEDRFVRYAARIAIEHQPVESWIEKAVAEKDPQAVLEIAMAAARNATPEWQKKIVMLLGQLDWSKLEQAQRLHLLRDYGLTLIRMGADDEFTRNQVREKFSALFPAETEVMNRELSRLLIAVEDSTVAAKTMQLLETAVTQEEQIHYVLSLRSLKAGWTPELRDQYFEWFVDAGKFKGGNSFTRFLQNIRKEAAKILPPEETTRLAKLIAKPIEQKDPGKDLAAREVVQEWTMEDLMPISDDDLVGRDLANGKKMFVIGQCYKCHRIERQGGIVGPDLTAAGRRFSPHDLLETIIDPSKAVSDQYQATKFQLESGDTVVGRIANIRPDAYMVQTNMLDPGNFTQIKVDEISGQKPSTESMMPTGLLNTMTRDDIIDLMGYMRSVGEVKK